MTDPVTARLFAALEAAGGKGCVLFVGGCVRDALVGREADRPDIDLAVALTPDRVQQAVEAAGLCVHPTGLAHGVVTVTQGGRVFEVASLRRDVATDGRRAVVAYSKDWREDAARRDFRLNALYANLTGEIFDPTGAGVADAQAGRIVFVGDPTTRIREDYLRSLRFFRFFAWYGRGDPDPVALAAIANATQGLQALSVERVAKEMLKLFAAPDPRAAVHAARETGVLAKLAPEFQAFGRFDRLVARDGEIQGIVDPLIRLTALLPSDPAAVKAMAQRLRLSTAERDRMAASAARALVLSSATPQADLRRAIWSHGAQAVKDGLRLALADAQAPIDAVAWQEAFAYADRWTPPPFPITGDDILAAGARPGPEVGAVRRDVEAWWLAQDFPADAAAAREQARTAIVHLREGK